MPAVNHTPSAPVIRVLVGVIVTLMIALPASFELAGDLPLPLGLYLPYAAFCGACLAFLARGGERALLRVALAAVLGALALLWLLPWSSRKTFLRAFDQVETGMTGAEVDRVLGRYPYLESGEGEHRVRAYRHSEQGRYDSDRGVLRFRGGRVRSKTFSAD